MDSAGPGQEHFGGKASMSELEKLWQEWTGWRKRALSLLAAPKDGSKRALDGPLCAAVALGGRALGQRISVLRKECTRLQDILCEADNLMAGDARARGKFIRKFFHMEASGTLASARGEDGLLVTDPKEYIPMAAETVARPFGMGVELDKDSGKVCKLVGPRADEVRATHLAHPPESLSVLKTGELPS